MKQEHFFYFKKVLAGIMVFMVLLVVLFSSFYIAAERQHNCSGDDCPVCACITQCRSALHQIGRGTAAYAAAPLSFTFLLVSVCLVVAVFVRETLITYGVRLDD